MGVHYSPLKDRPVWKLGASPSITLASELKQLFAKSKELGMLRVE